MGPGDLREVNGELLFFDTSFVLISPRFRNLRINTLIRGRVIPTITDNSSAEIFSSIHMPLDANSARAFLAEFLR
jgi:hypothetical protein